jgi:hypothetical protein
MSYESLSQHKHSNPIETILHRFKPPFEVLTCAEGDYVVDQNNDRVTVRMELTVARGICEILNKAYKKHTREK